MDRHVHSVIDELEALGMMENTIIVYTTEHAELAGAHGMSGKGATAYKEQNQVPMRIVHPDITGGATCQALTSHMDIAPTILSMAQGEDSKTSEILDQLRGKDFSGVLNDPTGAGVNDVRAAALYCFNMLSYYDPAFILDVAKTIQTKGKEDGVADLRGRGVKPDLRAHRGAIRSVFDGRYKFSRYFSSVQFNRPETLEQLTEVNDLELFDHETDPNETVNLAADLATNRDLVLVMNAKLNAVIAEEIGAEDGSFLGLGVDTDYAVDKDQVDV